jgi:hypothetical protein
MANVTLANANVLCELGIRHGEGIYYRVVLKQTHKRSGQVVLRLDGILMELSPRP